MKRKIIITIVLILIVSLLAGIVLFIISKNNDKNISSASQYRIFTDLNKVSSDNEYIKVYKKLNFGKILKSSQDVEGLFIVGDNNIMYSIKVHANNMLMYSSSLKNSSQFYMMDSNNELVPVGFFVQNNNVDAYNEMTSNSDLKGTEYTYNNWKFFKAKGRVFLLL